MSRTRLEKRFHASGMRAIDFSHKIAPRKVIFAQIQKNFFLEVLLQSLPPPFKENVVNEKNSIKIDGDMIV